MAARSALKLFGRSVYSNTKSYVVKPRNLSSAAHCLEPSNRTRPSDKQRRSFSQPVRSKKSCTRNEVFIHQVRKISKSSSNLKGSRRRDDDEDYDDGAPKSAFRYEDSEDPQTVKKSKVRKSSEPLTESDVRYEITGSSKEDAANKSDVFDVLTYMSTQEHEKPSKVFPHLQPNNIKPYGSTDNLFFVNAGNKRPAKIVYPKAEADKFAYEVEGDKDDTIEKVEKSSKASRKTDKRRDVLVSKEFSDYQTSKQYPAHEEKRKLAVFEKNSRTKHIDVNRKNFSTSSRSRLLNRSSKFIENESLAKYTARKFNTGIQTPKKPEIRSKITLTQNKMSYSGGGNVSTQRSNQIVNPPPSSSIAKPSNVLSATPRNLTAKPSLKRVVSSKLTAPNSAFPAKIKQSLWLLNKQASMMARGRNYSTRSQDIKTSEKISDFVTVKLKDLQEECRKKPKKTTSGRLPKFVPADCPCAEDPPMKEAVPLKSLKPRFVYKDPERICPDDEECLIPRADDNYKIKRKPLPEIKSGECPCTTTEMTDFKIKRLPKKHVPEPPKICIECVGEECCPPRLDHGKKIERKKLPVMTPPECPCVENPEMEEVPLRRLKAKPVPEPPKICIDAESCDVTLRADYNLKVTPKVLPELKPPECACLEPSPLKESPPLKRLNFKFIDPPKRICEDKEICHEELRADYNVTFKKKKLPVLVAPHCPCIEPEPMKESKPLKRLKARPVEERKKICVDEEECPERADHGMKVKPKTLPKIVPGECPCVEFEMKDARPLPRLKPKPVEEPKKLCLGCIGDECCPPRLDENLKVKKKTLPYLEAPDCPCVEPTPMKECKPLKKLSPRPVKEPLRICPDIESCDIPRADDGLKVKSKQLPVLKSPECPCAEEPPHNPGKPLKRLRKKKVPEPKRVCPPETDCNDAVRADSHDWMYWKRMEVGGSEEDAKKEICKSSEGHKQIKRYYSTSGIHYTSDLEVMKPSSYNVANLTLNNSGKSACDILVDMSTPMVRVDRNLSKVEFIKPVDYVGFVVYNSKRNPEPLKETKSNIDLSTVESMMNKSLFFNTLNRLISTCRNLGRKTNDPHLQPKNPIIKEVEHFIVPYPSERTIEISRQRSKQRQHFRKEHPEEARCAEETKASGFRAKEQDDCDTLEEDWGECDPECSDKESKQAQAMCVGNKDRNNECCKQTQQACEENKNLTLWERVVNYFKARPGCPTPEEFRRMRLKEEAERAATKAGLCLYDPMEECKNEEKDLPKVITGRDPCSKK